MDLYVPRHTHVLQILAKALLRVSDSKMDALPREQIDASFSSLYHAQDSGDIAQRSYYYGEIEGAQTVEVQKVILFGGGANKLPTASTVTPPRWNLSRY